MIQQDFEERSWKAFWRVVIDGQKPKDVAQELHMSANAVYLAKGRVLARLRESLPAPSRNDTRPTMVSASMSSPGTACPSREALVAYMAGKLPSADLESVAKHIAECAGCQSSLEEVPGETANSDSLIDKLRRCVSGAPPGAGR